jgi:predicted nucleic acid-binding protein
VILLDSNIVIYFRDPQWGEKIAAGLNGERLDTCNVVVAEVLGFRGMEAADSYYFAKLFSTMKNHILNDAVTNKVIEIQKATTIQLPDAIIAATALTNNLVLWTHNVADFRNVQGLRFVDPLTA